MMNLKGYQSECSFREEEHDARIGFRMKEPKCFMDLTSEDFDLPIQGK
jgi:hypothetical protein